MVCTCVFTLVAAGGYCLFGSSTNANILTNLTPQDLAPIIGSTAGTALSFAIRVGYCTCLCSTFASEPRTWNDASPLLQASHARWARHNLTACAPHLRLHCSAAVVLLAERDFLHFHPAPCSCDPFRAVLNWALRETVTKLLFQRAMLPGPGFYALSCALLLAIYAVAIFVPSGALQLRAGGGGGIQLCMRPSAWPELPQWAYMLANIPQNAAPGRCASAVWTAMSVTGATAATFIAFILPGLLILRVANRTHRLSATSTALASVCVGLGLLMGSVTLLNTFVLHH